MTEATRNDRLRIAGGPVLLYDGVCALCNGVVRFVIDHDSGGLFRFAPLEGGLARDLLGGDLRQDSVVVVTAPFTPMQRALRCSDAVLEVMRLLGWRRRAWLLAAVPRPLREAGYRIVAAVRYRIFGRYPTCPLPAPELRDRFLHD